MQILEVHWAPEKHEYIVFLEDFQISSMWFGKHD